MKLLKNYPGAPNLIEAARSLKSKASAIFYAFSETETEHGFDFRVASIPNRHENDEIERMFRLYQEAKAKHDKLLAKYKEWQQQSEVEANV